MIFRPSFRADGAHERRLARGPKKSRSRRPRGDDSGFTLIELLIVVTIVPLIIGALSAALLAVFSLQSGVSNRLSNTVDAQTVSANFTNDVQSAAYLTTGSSSSPQCGTGNQLLGVEWNYDAGASSS